MKNLFALCFFALLLTVNTQAQIDTTKMHWLKGKTINSQTKIFIKDSIIKVENADVFFHFCNKDNLISALWLIFDPQEEIDSLAIIINGKEEYIAPVYQTYTFIPQSDTSTFQIKMIIDGRTYHSHQYRLWFEDKE